MTHLTTPNRSRNVCGTLALIALAGCAGAHAAKTHTRTVKPAHSSTQSQAKPEQKPANPEPKPLVGELMA
jgi:hypothetical protein